MFQKSFLIGAIIVILLGVCGTNTAEAGSVNKKFDIVLVETEKLLIEILNDLSKEGKIHLQKLPFGQSYGPGLFMRNPDPDARIRMNGKMFYEPYVATIRSQAQGYCAADFDVAKMTFAPNLQKGDTYVMLSCGPFSDLNCSKKCKINVRAGRIGAGYETFGQILYAVHYNNKGAKSSVRKLKKDLRAAILEVAEFLR